MWLRYITGRCFRFGLDPYSIKEDQMAPKKGKKKAGSSLRRAEGFSWRMKVLHKSLKIAFFGRKKPNENSYIRFQNTGTCGILNCTVPTVDMVCGTG